MPPGRLAAGLVADRLIDVADALGGRVTLEDRSRSNPVWAVAVAGVDRFVVKQRGIRVDDLDPLAAEATAYSWLARAGLAGIAPGARLAAGGWLVVDAVDGATGLHEVVLRRDPIAAAAFAALGEALGRLHAAPVAGSGGGPHGTPPPPELVPRRPWVLSLGPRGLPPVVPPTEGVSAVRGRLLARPALAALLRELLDAWTPRAAIHGDLKFDNVLVRPFDRGEDGGAVVGIRAWLVDWELAGLGEPAWDVAGIVEGVVVTHVLANGRVDVPSAAALVAPAFEAYERGSGGVGALRPEPALLGWVAARLAQASLQLAAMAVDDASRQRADEVADLAISFAEEPLAWRPVLGLPVETA